jgi:GT2 family glycosyltransferase
MTESFQDIELSVVVPAIDHRGHLLEGLSSWSRGQTLSRDHYEVLLVTCGREPELVSAGRSLLAPGDRVITRELANEQALHDHGARQARGKWLLFTEGHCVPASDCLAELLAYLRAHEAQFAGACLRSTTDGNPHPLARLEERSYDEGFMQWSAGGDWRKVIVRGFAIRRDIYLEVGGFKGEFGCFAEVELAAALHAGGYQLGYADHASIKHYNSSNLREIFDYIREYRRVQAEYQSRCPPDRFESYFGWYGSWADATPSEHWGALSCATKSFLRAALRCFRPGPRALAVAMLGVLTRTGFDAITGRRAALLIAAATYALARVRFAQSGLGSEERYRRYTLLWDATGELARQRALLQITPTAAKLAPTHQFLSLEYQPGMMSSDALVGFHARELWNGEPFRWSNLLALVRLSVGPGDYEVWLETKCLRSFLPGSVDLYFNGHRAELVRPLETATNGLVFKIKHSMFETAGRQSLILATSRFAVRDSKERRILGAPVFKIAFVAVGVDVANIKCLQFL